MRHRRADHPEVRFNQLLERLEQLRVDAAERAASKRRKRLITIFAGSLIGILMTVSLSSLTDMVRRLDAEALAQIGRGAVARHLPPSRLALEDYLVAEAPRLVGQSLRELIEVLPRVRAFLTRGLSDRLDAINAEFQDEILHLMHETIRRSRDKIASDYPDLPEREQLEMLVADLAVGFNVNVTDATQALHPEYQSEMSRIADTLRRLRDTDVAELTEDERTKREIIETMLQLIVRERGSASLVDVPAAAPPR